MDHQPEDDMNREYFKLAYSNARSDWKLTMNHLFYADRKVICEVMNNRLPGRDKLKYRMSMQRCFDESRNRGVSAPISAFAHLAKFGRRGIMA